MIHVVMTNEFIVNWAYTYIYYIIDIYIYTYNLIHELM